MNIHIEQLKEGAQRARGITVIIDVFRAFSTACYAFEQGVEKIIPVGEVDLAYKLKEENPDYILLGERNERMLPGFDFGNSPTHLQGIDLSGKTVVQTTSSGTQGIVNATQADEILTGSFVNAGAIIEYIRKKNPEHVSLVAMGYSCIRPCDEDTALAEYVKNELEGVPNDFEAIVEKLRVGDGARLLDPANHEFSPASDFDLCLALNHFDFVLRVKQENGLHILEKVKL
ncbi:2-phosphosulfolactate phosphatase [Puteibacter caeruleilacunae]|nr:2-phosphosulfolactate phosphatase [Puteibacter caeruleilacunae]